MLIKPRNPALEYTYPEHLCDQLRSAPRAPGVYIFRSSSADFPLYIGKSVDIRSRLLSHFRDPRKSRLLRAASSIEFIRTAGDLGAMLLEARLIKTMVPLHNKRLRKLRSMFSIEFSRAGIQIGELAGSKSDASTRLFGIYASPRAAKESLREIADQHGLCYPLLGLEPMTKRACFRHALGRCAGACCGQESVEIHSGRLLDALKAVELVAWPYPGRIAIAERGRDLDEFHVIDRWQYLGTVPTPSMASSLEHPEPGFDRDGYKVLVKPIFSGRYEILPIG